MIFGSDKKQWQSLAKKVMSEKNQGYKTGEKRGGNRHSFAR